MNPGPMFTTIERLAIPRGLLSSMVVALVMVGCGPSGPPAPRPASLAGADPWVAAVVEKACDAADADPGDPKAWLELGDVFYAHDFFGLAAEAYARGIEIAPERPLLRYMRAVSLHEAEEPGALEEIDRALALDEETVHLRWRAAIWNLEAGELDRANDLAEEAVALAPTDRNAVRALGRVRLEQGRPEDAIRILSPLLRTPGDDAEIHAMLGTAFRVAGRPAESERAFLLAGKIVPTWFDAWIDRALLQRTDLSWWIRRIQRVAGSGRPDAARPLLDELRRWHPDAPECDYTEGVILTEEGRLDEAVELFERLLVEDPDWAAAASRAAACRLSRAAASLDPEDAGRDREAAERLLAGAVELEPDKENFLLLLTLAREELGRTSEAVSSAEILVERVPGNRSHRLRLARTLLEDDRGDEAVAVLDAAMETFGPEAPPALVARIEALVAAGRSGEAAAALGDLARRSPRHPERSRLERLVREGGRP